MQEYNGCVGGWSCVASEMANGQDLVIQVHEGRCILAWFTGAMNSPETMVKAILISLDCACREWHATLVLRS